MNERIKTLAIVADFDLYEDGYFHSHPPGQWINANLEKFAELIIEECLNQVRDEIQYIADWDKADHVVREVKKHFGVENG